MKIPVFLKTYNSPFKPIKWKWYVGKIKIGVPIFYPRVWRRYTEQELVEKANEAINDPSKIKKTFEEWKSVYRGYTTSVPKKLGFDFKDLYWKTKWASTDFRFEYSPVWSFVFFGYQIAVVFVPPHKDHYWEAFLYYFYATDKSKSTEERIKQCKKEFPQIWTTHTGNVKETIDYYDLILKDKYR